MLPPTTPPAAALCLAFCVALADAAGPPPASAQTAVGEYSGAAAMGVALRRLGTTARVLHIAAHPDDENTALFAPLALGRGIDAAYLSLTRGEGGQNGIGPELGIALGVIRSEELLAARRLDGGDQFFTRAIDYGYSKNAEEAFRHWPKDTLLADVVAIIRRYRPDVVTSVWSGTPSDRHGQHQAAGIVAREAVLAAGDPTRFPEQIEAGLRPHRTAVYYRSAWWSDDPPDVELDTGELDPLLGASYHQIAMASRSRHRSQDQGRSLTAGPRHTAFDRVDPAVPAEVTDDPRFGRYGQGAPGPTASLFAGVDTLLSQRAGQLPDAAGDAAGSSGLVALLREYEALVAEARAVFRPFDPWEVLPILSEARDRLEAAIARADRPDEEPPSAAAAALAFHLEAEHEDLQAALIAAGNVVLDVVADQELVVPGQTFRLELSVWNGGRAPVRVSRARPHLPEGWEAEPVRPEAETPPALTPADAPAPAPVGLPTVPAGGRAVFAYDVTVRIDAEPTTPYYLDSREPAPEDLYDWPPRARSPDAERVRGLPFASAPVRGRFLLGLGHAAGQTDGVAAERDAAHVAVDARDGEYREPVKVVPAVSVSLEPELAVIPMTDPERPIPFTVRLRGQAPEGVRGRVRPTLPAGWGAEPDSVLVELPEPGGEATATFRLSAPAGIRPGEYGIGVAFVTRAGDRHDLGYDRIDYPHIEPHHLYERSRARVRVLDVEVADVRVGYVPGAGDGVPEALDQLGVDWAVLDTPDLARGDLSRFDVIVTGIRAYEVRDDIVAHNQRLLDWVRRGGTLIVQYNKYPALERDYAPWPVTIARPHGRVTDETAPVTVLEPDHPALTTPNPIGDPDWRGWVQERGLYFWDSWDGPLTPLLAMGDPGEEPLTGSLLVAPLGEGTYVYTGLAFFRQLPEGVPGAYRLFANLISLGGDR